MVGFISPMSDKSKSMVSLRRSLSGAWTPMESAEPSFVLLRRIWENAPLSKNGTPQPVQPAVSMVSFAIIYYIILMLLFFFEVNFQTDTQPTCQPVDGKWGFPSWAGVQQHRAHASSCHADCTCTTWLPWTCSGLGNAKLGVSENGVTVHGCIWYTVVSWGTWW